MAGKLNFPQNLYVENNKIIDPGRLYFNPQSMDDIDKYLEWSEPSNENFQEDIYAIVKVM